MEIKNLYDPAAKLEIIERINKLTSESQRQWGKMDVAQMLAHLQQPLEVALGHRTIKGSFLMNLILPLFKKTLWDEKTWKKGIPTDPTYITVAAPRNFQQEKAKLLELISQFTEAALSDKKHPVFGFMTKEQWSRSGWKHIDHHLKQFGV